MLTDEQEDRKKERQGVFLFVVPLTGVRSMHIYKVGSTTMQVKWKAAEGAEGYMLVYSAINATKPSTEQKV